MKRFILLFVIPSFLTSFANGEEIPPVAQADPRVEVLLAGMTLEEKVGQMCQYVGIELLKKDVKKAGGAYPDDPIPMYPGMTFEVLENLVRQGKVGSFLHVTTVEESNRLQALAAQSRLKIPLIIGIDAIHGDGLVHGATVYPASLGLACSFDEPLAKRIASETALETRANGSHWTFVPNVDVARDARWGRTGETFGEDPFLVSRLGAATVRGLQGDNGIGPDHILACVKHAIAGSQPVNGLNAAPTDVSEHTLRSVFLPPYLAAFKAGAGSLMTAHHELNGVPCHANPWLVDEVLRKEGGFTGFVVSDWLDIEGLVTMHKVAANQKEAVYQTVMGGVDMHMHGPGFFEPLVELVKEGRIPESRVDESVRRILHAKFELGLFDQSQTPSARTKEVTFCDAHQQTALEAARKGIVLLKNENSLLPLDPARFKQILVTGPLADTQSILGDWVTPQPDDNVITVQEGLKKVAPEGCRVNYFDSGSKARATAPAAIQEATERAAASDLTVLVVGENSMRFDNADKTSGEEVDRSDIELPGNQLALVQAVVASGKPVVVVLVNSRPIGSEWTMDHVPAVLEAWEPGCKGGQAIAEVLFGLVNPSGKLAITIPRSAGYIQSIYNHKPSHYSRKYAFGKTVPLFEFGHGLSYTTFKYENLRLPAKVSPGDNIVVRVDVTNTGARSGDEVVLAFVHDVVSSTTTPVKSLQSFKRISLSPGQKQTVEMSIAYDQLALFNAQMKRAVEPGEFEVLVGDLKGRLTTK
jgi:beta-glucosidase